MYMSLKHKITDGRKKDKVRAMTKLRPVSNFNQLCFTVPFRVLAFIALTDETIGH